MAKLNIIFVILAMYLPAQLYSSESGYIGGDFKIVRKGNLHFDVYINLYYQGDSTHKSHLMLDPSVGGSHLDTARWLETKEVEPGVFNSIYLAHCQFPSETSFYQLSVRDTISLPELVNLKCPPGGCHYVLHTKFTIADLMFTEKTNDPPYFDSSPGSGYFNNGIFTYLFDAIDEEGDIIYYKPKNWNTLSTFPYLPPDTLPFLVLYGYTGEMIWDKPTKPGKYLIGVDVYDLKGSIILSRTSRDIIIEIKPEDLTDTDHPYRQDSFVVYPNPFTNQLVIENSQNGNADSGFKRLFEVRDISNRLIYSSQADVNDNYTTLNINTNNWPSGYYILLEYGSQSLASKLLFKQ